jgi:hypothetical protein
MTATTTHTAAANANENTWRCIPDMPIGLRIRRLAVRLTCMTMATSGLGVWS